MKSVKSRDRRLWQADNNETFQFELTFDFFLSISGSGSSGGSTGGSGSSGSSGSGGSSGGSSSGGSSMKFEKFSQEYFYSFLFYILSDRLGNNS